MGRLDSALQIPIGVIYAAIPISGVLSIFYCLYNQYGLVRTIFFKAKGVTMDIAIVVALVMFIGAFLLLFIGTPISVSIGLSSFFAMAMILPFDGAILTSAQRIFVGLDFFRSVSNPVLYSGG